MTTTSATTSEIEEILTRLVRVVRRADKFVLGFVKCNSPVQQQQLNRTLKERLSDKRAIEITLDEPIISLLDELTQIIDVNDPPAFVNVFGLEKSIYAQQDYSPVLGRLNNDRDLIRRACPAVLLIWLPDYALDKVVISAPDFWAWRSGVYEFPTESGYFQNDSILHLNTKLSNLLSMTREDKHQEIERLEELLRTAQALPHQQYRENLIIARLLLQLGGLYSSLGDGQKSQERFQQSLDLAKQTNDPQAVSTALDALADIEVGKGNLESAQRFYEESLRVEEQNGNLYNVAISQSRLGNLYTRMGQLEEAEQSYQRSLERLTQSSKRGAEYASVMALILFGLGYIHYKRRHWKEAGDKFQTILAIADDIGYASLRSVALFNLGLVEQAQGNLSAAEDLYCDSLRISCDLGNKRAEAGTLARLGELKRVQGNYKEAVDNLMHSLALFKDIQSTDTGEAYSNLQKVRMEVGKDQFEQWIQQTKRSSPWTHKYKNIFDNFI